MESRKATSAKPKEVSLCPTATKNIADQQAIRVLALIEANLNTGPAWNLIEFASRARQPEAPLRPVEIAVVTFIRGREPENPFVIAAKKAGLQLYTLYEDHRYDTSVGPQLREVLARHRPDVLQSHNIKSHLLVRWLRLYRDYPWVAFNHGYTKVDLKDRLYNQCDRWSLRRAHRVVAVCGPFAQRLVRWGIRSDRIRVQHNFVIPYAAPERGAIQRVREKLSLDGQRTVLCVGRLSREKGHTDLLTAMALLRERRPELPIRVIVLGEGVEQQKLLEQRRRLRLEKAVTFVGFIPEPSAYYAVADILALPSHSEGSPHALLEAMSAGVPAVATAVGGVPEILRDGQTGLLVPKQDPSAMASAIERLLSDRQLAAQVSAAARMRAAESYSPGGYCRTMAMLYQDVLASWPQERTSQDAEIGAC